MPRGQWTKSQADSRKASEQKTAARDVGQADDVEAAQA
jgi:hypothetical protein